jgi:ATP-dependent RNA helicase DeaD
MSALPEDLAEQIGPELDRALRERGFTALTPVQEAVLDPSHEGRDLRISSQTGSGKTVAIGLALRDLAREPAETDGRNARPRALVVAPTRELAKQVEEELGWLYGALGLKIAVVTGGPSYRDELRSFKRGPVVVVGTPGRLLDHVTRGGIDTSAVAAVVLDEADRMLDMGFREDLEKIFAATPEDRRTHLVSATFPREVTALADRVQTDPVRVEGTPLGKANTDIEHVIHLVHPKERLGAIVNLLLAHPGAQTLVFARTRADVSDLASALSSEGFAVGMLSGEMEQPERNRALAAFKRGSLDLLVATDVAARGIDVVDIARVIHAEPPADADAYTHRSGRTGRAGRKGTSAILVSPAELVKTLRLLSRARVQHRVEGLPTAADIRAAEDERLYAELTSEGSDATTPPDARAQALAEKLLQSSDVTRVLARLVARAWGRHKAEPRELTRIDPPARSRVPREREHGSSGPPREREHGSSGPPRARDASQWVQFRLSWGQSHGADTRRVMAMLCRRGKIEGRDIGAIRIQRTSSVVEIAKEVAEAFERTASKPDPRDPRIVIRRWVEDAGDRRPSRPSPRSPRRDR